MFTELNGPHAAELNDALGRIGFRRSQSVAYRPSCIDCQSCVSVRVVADEFRLNATQRKLIRRNADLAVAACRPWTTEEQYDLLRRYLATRHPGGGMADMDDLDFADMVEQTPVKTFVVEYRDPAGQLIGACLTDQQADGLSMIYSFFDSDEDKGDGGRRGLGMRRWRSRRGWSGGTCRRSSRAWTIRRRITPSSRAGSSPATPGPT